MQYFHHSIACSLLNIWSELEQEENMQIREVKLVQPGVTENKNPGSGSHCLNRDRIEELKNGD
jgi:hypothetical protein